jgi:hypothetical protein
MRPNLSLRMLRWIVLAGVAWGAQQAIPASAQSQGAGQAEQQAGAAKGAGQAPSAEEAKLLSSVREALERNAQEIKALKDQYSRDMAEQRKKVDDQQKQIQTLQDQLRSTQAPDRLQKLSEVQQKQIGVLEEQSQLVADQLERQGPVVEKLQTQAATLESRSKQAAQRDKEIADAYDSLVDSVDNLKRNPPWLSPQLKAWYLSNGTNVTPVSIYNTVSTLYTVFPNRKGAGNFSFDEFTPFFIYQLNKRFLLTGEVTFNTSGASLGQAQIDMFINDWLTADAGFFLAPIGFMNERLDPGWIIKTPDLPLSMLQVIPDGLTLMGLQLRGAKYLLGSPFKLEYSAFMTNGLGVPGQGAAADWADLGGVAGTSGSVNQAMAYGGRIGVWYPARGINFGVSEFVNAPYTKMSGANMSIWQPYFNYHRGNWDFRFEYGNMYEQTRQFIGNNIRRDGFYTQLAYRDYKSLNKHLQRLEYVGRYSQARFHGIDQKNVDPTAFDPPNASPVDRNQYLLGVNYYFYASTVLKLAYEFNNELRGRIRDDIFMMQFVTNF